MSNVAPEPLVSTYWAASGIVSDGFEGLQVKVKEQRMASYQEFPSNNNINAN
jgi:hypothetical protein